MPESTCLCWRKWPNHGRRWPHEESPFLTRGHHLLSAMPPPIGIFTEGRWRSLSQRRALCPADASSRCFDDLFGTGLGSVAAEGQSAVVGLSSGGSPPLCSVLGG